MKDKLQQEINRYRKDRNKLALASIQAVVSAIQERENRENKELSENDILKVIESEKNKYIESAKAFAGRDEEADCKMAIEILDEFLPQKIHINDYNDIADKAISESNATSLKDMGKVMASIKEDYGVAVDMKEMSALVKEKLMQF